MRLWCGSLGVLVALGAVQSAQAIVVHSSTATAETSTPILFKTAPSNGAPWDNVGWRGSSAVYLGDGFVLTAAHVGAGSFRVGDDPTGGTTYAMDGSFAPVTLKNPDSSNADLVLFRVLGSPTLPAVPIADTSPLLGDSVVMIGTGSERGSELKPIVLPGPGPYPSGYDWADTRDKIWAPNTVAEVTAERDIGGVTNYAYLLSFDNTDLDGQAANNDSGSGVFIFDTLENRWELSGITIAIGTWQDQPAGTSAFGNITVVVDLSVYRSQILAAIPEPGSVAMLAAAAGGLMIRRRRTA